MSHEFEIFDIDQHVGSTGDAHGLVHDGQKSGAGAVPAEVQNRLAFMDDLGVRESVAIPGHHYNRAAGARATMAENDAIAAYRAACRDRFPVAVGIVEPLDQQAALDAVRVHRRCRAQRGFRYRKLRDDRPHDPTRAADRGPSDTVRQPVLFKRARLWPKPAGSARKDRRAQHHRYTGPDHRRKGIDSGRQCAADIGVVIAQGSLPSAVMDTATDREER